jgi:hypothetical protein
MTATTLPDFTITCSSRRRACVIDSALALSVYGLPIAKQLGEWLELWVVREFWHLLEARDATRFVLPQLTPSMERALQEWERLRQHVDSQHRPVNVLADVLGDSSLPAGSDPDLIWRWESLAQALDRLLEAQGLPIDAPTMASRDLVALAAARNACILTLRSAAEPQAPPSLCRSLQHWGIRCWQIPAANDWGGLDAALLRQLFVNAGLAPLVWAGMDLCVVHLFVPSAATLGSTHSWGDFGFGLESGEEDPAAPLAADCLWEGAQVFWYPLAAPEAPLEGGTQAVASLPFTP